MTATHAALPMYDLPELTGAHEHLWRALRARLRRAGVRGDAPLVQICGYPLITRLAHAYDVVAAPRYDVAFCAGTTHRALVVVAADAPYASLEDLRATRFALNALDSNTGMNLPRRLIAPLARAGRFFRDVVATGSHLASLTAVATGAADAASIDNVTFALLAEHRPAAIRNVRVLTVTNPSPTLPFVTPNATQAHVKAALFAALEGAIDDLRAPGAGDDLHLTGIERASHATYAPLAAYAREAAELGYGVLA